MKTLVKVKLSDKTHELINEEQICRIRRGEGIVFLHMANGDVLEVVEPPFDDWENDLFIRQ